MSTQTNDAVTAFFKNPLVAKAVVNQVMNKKPKSWGPNSNSPYYSERFARDIQRYVDGMIVDKQDRFFPYEGSSHKPATIYIRLHQSLMFLCDKLDDENFKYANFKAQTMFRKDVGGIRLTYNESVTAGGEVMPLNACVAAPLSKTYVWREQVDDFLDKPEKTELRIDNIMLIPEQRDGLEVSLSTVKGIIYNITATSIKIIKTNE